MQHTSHPATLDATLSAIITPYRRSGALDAPEPCRLAVRAIRAELAALGLPVTKRQAWALLWDLANVPSQK